MALYSEPPVDKATNDLLLAIFRFTKDFGKEYKYTVGKGLKKETIGNNQRNANSTFAIGGSTSGRQVYLRQTGKPAHPVESGAKSKTVSSPWPVQEMTGGQTNLTGISKKA